MQKPNVKLYLVLIGVVFLFLVAALLVPFGKKGPETDKTKSTAPQTLPSPTTYPGGQTPYTYPTAKPKMTTAPIGTPEVHPTGFTGVKEEQLPKEIADLSKQKQELRGKTPLTQPAFTITFDYGEDKFVVTLKEPKGTSKSSFDQWLRTNYPAIPSDRFAFK